MAATGLLALLDDITSLLDDIATMTKVTAKKTAGLVGDDLAVNAEKVTGVSAQRELPVIWAVAKGSLLNKLILVPAALVLSIIAPWLVTLLLIAGGVYLCYEGFEKSLHALCHGKNKNLDYAEVESRSVKPVNEQEKIKGAIRTDFILSAEIIVIALGVVKDMDLPIKIAVLSTIALAMTVGVYGLVALLLKLDDFALHLMASGRDRKLRYYSGSVLLRLVPYLMASLSILGTLAMFMVGGGIIAHNVHYVGEAVLSMMLLLIPYHAVADMLGAMFIGIAIGAIALTLVKLAQNSVAKLLRD